MVSAMNRSFARNSWQSGTAYFASYVAHFMMVIAVLTLIYLLATADWHGVGNLSVNTVLAVLAALLTPPFLFGVAGLFLLLASHAVEYLARASAASES